MKDTFSTLVFYFDLFVYPIQIKKLVKLCLKFIKTMLVCTLHILYTHYCWSNWNISFQKQLIT